MQTLPNGDTFYPAEFNVREVKELSRTDYLRLYT